MLFHHNAFSDELKKRISEGYAIVRSKLNDDIKPKFDARSALLINCLSVHFLSVFVFLNATKPFILVVQSGHVGRVPHAVGPFGQQWGGSG